MNPSLMKRIVFAHFDGTATAIQRKSLEAWLADPVNQETYYQYLDEWEDQRPQFPVDTDTALNAFQPVLHGTRPQPVTSSVPPKIQPFWTRRWPAWSLAASIAVVSLLGALLFRHELHYRTYQTAYGQTATYQLSDGTAVTLNANSRLRVPRFGFSRDARAVFLEGEGAFTVTHTADHQRFVVQTPGDLQVEVLGTEFVVYARERGKRVFLNKGSVKLRLPKGEQLYLKPGNVVTVANSGRYQLVPAAPAQPYVAWKEHWFYFDNTPVSEVARQIEERFGVTVVVADPELAQRRIAGNFKAEKADDLFQILTPLLNLTVVRERHRITLRLAK